MAENYMDYLGKEFESLRRKQVSDRQVLLYKNARVDQNILDETFGMFGWKRSHSIKNNEIYCTVAVKYGGEWIEKEDVETPSFSELVKGAVSDSFKRCCTNWGIGRSLYSAPFIWLSSDKVKIEKEKERYVTRDRFAVTEIGYDEHEVINRLVIENQRGEVVYSFGKAKPKGTSGDKIKPIQEQELRKEMKRTGVSEDMVCQRYKVSNLKEMNQALYDRAMEALGKSKNAA